jgi:NAD(P)H-nitrite reductase large subunit
MRYVIIGNSAAGIGAVEGIRQRDRQGEIILITHEAHHTYSRPLISYLLLGKVTEETMRYRDENFYTANNCTLLRSCTATAIDAEAKCVLLSGGGSVPYDKLLVAAGSSAFVPPIEGLSAVKNAWSFM